MFAKFKSMVLDALAQSEARFELGQEKSLALFRDTNETHQQERLKSINDMMNQTPDQMTTGIARINAGIDPSYEQIMKQQREKDKEALMFKASRIRNELETMDEKDKSHLVVSVLAEGVKNTVIASINKVRNKGLEIKTEIKNKITF